LLPRDAESTRPAMAGGQGAYRPRRREL